MEISDNQDEIISILKEKDVDCMSPREALEFLYELKGKVGK